MNAPHLRSLKFLLFPLCLLVLCRSAFGNVGSVDASFDAPAPNDWVRAIAVQPDGKILVAGDFTTLGGTNRARIARLLSNGHVDPSFDPGTGPNAYISSMALQTNGQVLISGYFTSVGGTARARYARLNSDGTLDPNFAAVQPAIPPGEAKQILSLPGGKAMLVGPTIFFSISPILSRAGLIRLNSDGTCDTNFTVTSYTGGGILAAAVTPAGKYLMAGTFRTTGGNPRTNLVQVDITGAQDNNFLQAPVADLSFVRTVNVQPDGRIVVCGPGTTANQIRRVNSNGTADGSFGSPYANSSILTSAVQPDDQIWIAGDLISVNGNAQGLKAARLKADGSFDASFNPGVGTTSSILALALQADGKLLMGGAFACYNDFCLGTIIRLLGDLTANNPHLVGSTLTMTVTSSVGKNYTLQYRFSDVFSG